MKRALHKLSATMVKHASPGKYNDGGGLYLFKRPDGGGQWYLRVVVQGRRREMGLGSIQDITLKEARTSAEHWRGVAKQGADPIKEREKQRREEARKLHCLRDVAADAFESRKAELKGDGKAGRWFSPLEVHVLPKLGKVPVSDIDQIDIRDALKPIWHSKGETARKALNRLSIVLRHAAALGLDVDLQATDKARELLGKSRQKSQHIPATPWAEAPEFFKSLEQPSIVNLALKLLMLTAVRSMPIRFMRYEHISDDVWTIPAELMKGRVGATQNFMVPLSPQALQVIELCKSFDRDGYLFPGARKGVMSDAAMSSYMKRAEMPYRPHGFRSTFRDWLADQTEVPYDVAETCLAHVGGSQVERAYRRTDYLEKRRSIMRDWGRFLASSAKAV